MESAPPPPSSFVLSYEFSSSSRNLVRRGSEIGGSRVPRLIRRIVTVIFTCIFATVGVVVGAITGGLIGLATESGIFRGSAIGAISGAVFSIEAVESSLAIWSGSGIYSILFVVDIILSLLSGSLVREKVGPAVQNAVERQMSAMDAPLSDVSDIFETSSGKGMAKEMVEKLPKVVVTAENNVDASGEPICCSVCLQDLEVGETVRRLPRCEHMFHVPCIDGWLVGHGSCPLCRRDF